MLIAHYTHRLPAGHDMAAIRTRAQARGPVWDDAPDLYFKAFLLREAGCHGAIANSYASLYLWRDDGAFGRFLADGKYRIVTDSFGRAPIATWIVLDARRGGAPQARFAAIEETDLHPDADLTQALAAETARNRAAAAGPGVAAAVVGVDTGRWRIVRIVLSETAPDAGAAAVVHDILHLAAPLLDSLPG